MRQALLPKESCSIFCYQLITFSQGSTLLSCENSKSNLPTLSKVYRWFVITTILENSKKLLGKSNCNFNYSHISPGQNETLYKMIPMVLPVMASHLRLQSYYMLFQNLPCFFLFFLLLLQIVLLFFQLPNPATQIQFLACLFLQQFLLQK